MNTHRDIIIIGAGPAGLSAAFTAAGYGLDVLVVDEQPSPGGQIYRNIERASEHTMTILGMDYGQGLALIERFRASQAEYLGNAIVWRIDPSGNICFSRKGQSMEINARHILIATGAMERPVPFAGWTLPGVMSVGAVDANFKSSNLLPRGPVVLAGSGPLLLSTAGHLVSCGVAVTAVLDTTHSPEQHHFVYAGCAKGTETAGLPPERPGHDRQSSTLGHPASAGRYRIPGTWFRRPGPCLVQVVQRAGHPCCGGISGSRRRCTAL
jgi:hypothetical protein